MTTEELRQAGFTDQEIGEYVSVKRSEFKAAGFTDTEVNEYYGMETQENEFARSTTPEQAAEWAGKEWQAGVDFNIPLRTVRANREALFGSGDPTEPPHPTQGFPKVDEPVESWMEAHPEHNDLTDWIFPVTREARANVRRQLFGYEEAAKPDYYWDMNPIKQAAFDEYMFARHQLTRYGGAVVGSAYKPLTKDVLELYNDELVNNPKWYQKSPEVAGWATEQAVEYWAMKGLWKATGLGTLFGKVGEKLAKPFLATEITAMGGAQVLPTLSKAGLKQLGKDAAIRVAKNAPGSMAFLATWKGGKAAINGEDIQEAAISGALWGFGLEAIASGAGPLGQIIMATPVGKKLQVVASQAYTWLWTNYPRVMNAGRAGFSDEFMGAAKREFYTRFGRNPTAAEEAILAQYTRKVGDEVIKSVRNKKAWERYWYGHEIEYPLPEIASAAEQARAEVNAVAKVVPPDPAVVETYWNEGAEAAKDVAANIAAATTKPPEAAVKPEKAAKKTKPVRATAEQAPAVKEKEAPVKVVHTAVPPAWKGRSLVETPKKGLRLKGKGNKVGGTNIFPGDPDLMKVPKRLPPATMKAIKAATDEIWPVHSVKGDDYFLVPSRVVNDLKAKLGPDAFKQRPVPEPSPLQLMQRAYLSWNIHGKDPADLGDAILWIADKGGIPAADIPERFKEYIDAFKERERGKDIVGRGVQEGGAEEIQPRDEYELAEREAIQQEGEDLEAEIGDSLDGIEEGEAAAESPVATDMLGRQELSGGVKGETKPMVDIEQTKVLAAREADIAAADAVGQMGLPTMGIPTKEAPAKVVGTQKFGAAKGTGSLFGDAEVNNFIDGIKKPKPPADKFKPGMVDISIATDAVMSVVEKGAQYATDLKATTEDIVEGLKFYPNVPMELRNDIRTDIIGASTQAGHRIYSQLAPAVLTGLTRDEIETVAQIIYAKDELARTRAGKGNPDLTVADAQRQLDDLTGSASPEILRAVENMAKIQDAYTKVLIDRGLIDADGAMEDYARHYVVDYTPEWAFRRGLPPMKLRTPFRGYTRKAVGTTKEYYRNMESILFSFYEKEMDNIIADFIDRQTAKYNILPTMTKRERGAMFGVNRKGNPKLPKPGRIYTVNGQKVRAFSPDMPFARTFYKTENGELAVGGYKHVSLLPIDIYEAFNSFTQRGGAIIAQINRFTRMWKSMAIFSHFTGFTLNNIVGDTVMAAMQSPHPDQLVRAYPKAFRYLLGKGRTQFYKDLEKFIVEEDIVQGMLTTTELESFRKSSTPLGTLMRKMQKFSEFREAVNRVAYAITLLERKQAGYGQKAIDEHDWIDTTGLDPQAALGKIARDVEVDYKWVSKNWARYISGAAAPFGTWYFKASANTWRWMSKHWGKALVTFLAAPVAAAFFNDRSKESRDMEKQLPDSVRSRVHFVLGKNPDGSIRYMALQLPQDALIGTKIFSIATSHVNRVILGEETAEEAAIKTLKEWGYKETAGTMSLVAPIGRFIWGMASSDRRDPYDKAPVYTRAPGELTEGRYWYETMLYGIKCMTPILSASISSYEKGMPQDTAIKDAFGTLAGKRALGIYDVNPRAERIITMDDGRIVKLTWDDNAKIEWIAKHESGILDDIQKAFIHSAKMPDEFYNSPEAQKQLLRIHEFWNKFAPDLNKDANDADKAAFVMQGVGDRLIHRIFSPASLKKWYDVRLKRAKTDTDKATLGEQYQRLMSYRVEEAIKGQPKTARQAYMTMKISDSDMPVELLWQLP